MTASPFLTGGAKLAGAMGWPIKHSRSPRLHGCWLRDYGIDGAYLPLAVPPERLEDALRGLVALGFRGANLTLPHKEAAMRVVDETSETAKRIGAINTITVGEDGRLFGDNTDAFGFMASLKDSAPAWKAAAGAAVILGAGGAARAVAVALIEAGAPALRVANRTRERAERLAEALRPMAAGRPVDVVDWDERSAALEGAGLLVNATSLGMEGQPPLEVDLAPLPRSALVTDIVYAPLDTDLLKRARERGHPAVDGLGMLLHQGRPGFRAWFGVDPEVTERLRAVVLGN
jgi:shikimate dehydrogenase